MYIYIYIHILQLRRLKPTLWVEKSRCNPWPKSIWAHAIAQIIVTLGMSLRFAQIYGSGLGTFVHGYTLMINHA